MPSIETQIQEQMEEQIKLTRQMLDPETGLQAKINKLEAAGKASAEEKEAMQKMAQDNSAAIEKANKLSEEQHKALTDRLDEWETKIKETKAFSGDGASGDPYLEVTKAVTELELPPPPQDLSMAFRREVKNGIGLGNWDAKTLFGKTVTSLAASAGDAQIPVYEPTIREPGQQPVTLLDALPRTTTESPLIYWVVEVLGSRVNNVGIQSLDFTGTDQGTALGESDFVFDQKSAETRTFGHTAKIALQILQDVGQLRGYLDNQMRYMVRFDVEDQILNGDGTGKNISGLKDQATAYDVSLDAGVTSLQKIDVLAYAIHQAALTFFPATFAILHPTDVVGIKLIKDGNDNYMFVNPMADGTLRPWGVPILSTTAQTADEFTVGAFNQVEVVIRRAVEVEVSTENEDDFDKLLATMRAYGRFGLKIYQPGSIIDGDFSLALTGTA